MFYTCATNRPGAFWVEAARRVCGQGSAVPIMPGCGGAPARRGCYLAGGAGKRAAGLETYAFIHYFENIRKSGTLVAPEWIFLCTDYSILAHLCE
jgi:hypothetical protein